MYNKDFCKLEEIDTSSEDEESLFSDVISLILDVTKKDCVRYTLSSETKQNKKLLISFIKN